MSIIYEGNVNYQQNFPLLYVNATNGINLRETAGGTIIRTLPNLTWIHYLKQYYTTESYRWFQVRVWRTSNQWDVGWLVGFDIVNGVYNVLPPGQWFPDGIPNVYPETRICEVSPSAPIYSSVGDYLGTFEQNWGASQNPNMCISKNYSTWYQFPIGEVEGAISAQIVHYPGQETIVKPYLVSGKSTWTLAGGWLLANAWCNYPGNYFIETGMKTGANYLRKGNIILSTSS
ncbi:MAG: hypothetical protein N2484_00985 [Clostridia bacterium]|nr:hypothetical protein [Clostridia bacterium]